MSLPGTELSVTTSVRQPRRSRYAFAASATRTGRVGRSSFIAARTRRSSIASGGRTSSKRVSGTERIICSPNAMRRSSGCLPLAEVKSLLFGHALVSLPFCAYGGVAATEADAVKALHGSARELGATLGVGTPRAARPCGARSRLAATGPLCHVPQGDPAEGRRQPRGDPAQAAGDGAQGHRTRPGESRSTPTSTASLRSTRTTCTGTGRRRCRSATSRRCSARFGRDCEVLTVTEPGGKAVSSVLSFYFRDEVLPYYAGDVEAARDLAANDFKYWELLRRACERGLRSLRLRPEQAGHRVVRVQEELGLRAEAAGVRILPVPPRAHPGKQSAQSEVPGADGAVAATADSGGEPRRSAPGQGPGLNGAMAMETLLFLSHRLPYPPNKGDKVRSYHLLRHLTQRYRVVLGTFIDDPTRLAARRRAATDVRRGARRGDRSVVQAHCAAPRRCSPARP